MVTPPFIKPDEGSTYRPLVKAHRNKVIDTVVSRRRTNLPVLNKAIANCLPYLPPVNTTSQCQSPSTQFSAKPDFIRHILDKAKRKRMILTRNASKKKKPECKVPLNIFIGEMVSRKKKSQIDNLDRSVQSETSAMSRSLNTTRTNIAETLESRNRRNFHAFYDCDMHLIAPDLVKEEKKVSNYYSQFKSSNENLYTSVNQTVRENSSSYSKSNDVFDNAKLDLYAHNRFSPCPNVQASPNFSPVTAPYHATIFKSENFLNYDPNNEDLPLTSENASLPDDHKLMVNPCLSSATNYYSPPSPCVYYGGRNDSLPEDHKLAANPRLSSATDYYSPPSPCVYYGGRNDSLPGHHKLAANPCLSSANDYYSPPSPCVHYGGRNGSLDTDRLLASPSMSTSASNYDSPTTSTSGRTNSHTSSAESKLFLDEIYVVHETTDITFTFD